MALNESAALDEMSTPSQAPTSGISKSSDSPAQVSEVEDMAAGTPGQPDEVEIPPNYAAISQPMTASNSSSSNPSLKDIAGGPSPYGTRSRNRGGASRPNYAEDREMEMDYEMQAATKEEEMRKTRHSPDPSSSVAQEPAGPSIGARSAVGQGDHSASGQVTPKDHIPGTSIFSAQLGMPAASAQPSKKRKAASQSVHAAANTPQPPYSAPASGQTTTRTASVATQAALAYRESNLLTFENCGGLLTGDKLIADDGTTMGVNDHVYLVCEPPGEPYYLGRIMEFLHVNNDTSKPVEDLRMNWYYRPKDIGRKVNDTRQVFASMHSDISPLTSLRGLCQIQHKSEIENMDEFRRTQDCFWYEKLYDRYIHRYYEVIPTVQVINVPAEVKRVLHDRWKFILVESGRGKELTSAVKSCKRCSGYCASNNSVDCAVCRQTYHMNCVRPPLLKKPSRGFAWACGPCSRAQERKLEARNTPNLADGNLDIDEELLDEDEEEAHLAGDSAATGGTSPALSISANVSVQPATDEQVHQASLWPFRYLGVHCKVEDALDYDDRIYPRASSRLGPRHQANVALWYGRPVEFEKVADVKRKYMKGGGHKSQPKLSKETLAAVEADKLAKEKRPKWVQDEPTGYVPRGEDFDNDDPLNTAELLFKPIPDKESSLDCSQDLIDDYLVRAREFSKVFGVTEYSVNFLDKAMALFTSANYDAEGALRALAKVDKKELKEPELTAVELKRFEDGVAKFGSELHSVKKYVRTVSSADIVRFYYTWKKTERGKQIWGNYAGRKGKKEAKEAKKAEANLGKLQDDVADDHDDSAFDNEKAILKKRCFQCKFCSTRTSRQWRRAPNTPAGTTVPADPSNKAASKDKTAQLMVALCLNCAIVWRKYAVQWEDGDDHRRTAQNGGKKRKIDDPLREFQLSDINWAANSTDAATTPSGGTPIPQTVEPTRKKIKNGEKDFSDASAMDYSNAVTAGPVKKAKVEKPAGPPPAPEIPKPRQMPCAVCLQMEPLGDQHISCNQCRMTVHRNCYGVVGESRGFNKWICDTCSNDRTPAVSTKYKCVLCPVEFTTHDFVEPPKPTHKKRSEKDKEKDRIERETAIKAAEYYRKKQKDLNRPLNPREPLKRTHHSNWIHVTCAVWTPEIKFGSAEALERAEGVPSISSARHVDVCKACKHQGGACVSCHSCKAPVHVSCAHAEGYVLGFDIVPVKGSRKDQVNIVNINGEVGTMTAAVWCKEHIPTKTIVHRMYDIVDEKTGLNALQLFVRNFKRVDSGQTRTTRNAALASQSSKVTATSTTTLASSNRRTSTTTVASTGGRGSVSTVKIEETSAAALADLRSSESSTAEADNYCITCGVDVSPKWWPYPPESVPDPVLAVAEAVSTVDTSPMEVDQLTNGHTAQNGNPKQQVALATAALSENAQGPEPAMPEVQCHKCHWKKVLKPPMSPVRPPILKQETPILQPPIPAPTIAAPPLPSPSMMPSSTTRYGWPSARPQSPPRPYVDWSRPSVPPPPPVNPIHPYGSRSPLGGSMGLNQHPSGVPQSRPPVNMPQSPHMNGGLQQSSNGYPPQSPHRGMSAPRQMQNGVAISYAPSMPAPYHLTNGGPPPRASENPFSQGGPPQFRSQYGGAHGSPPGPREPPLNRDMGNQGGPSHSGNSSSHPNNGPPHPNNGPSHLNNGPPHNNNGPSHPSNGPPHNNNGPSHSSNGRVNGGASASPSLRNLLS